MERKGAATNLLVAKWDKDGRLTVNFVPKDTVGEDAATGLEVSARKQVLPAGEPPLPHENQDHPARRRAKHNPHTLGRFCSYIHVWGD